MSEALVIGRRKAVVIQNNPSVSEGEINDSINTVGKVFKSEVITSDQPWIVPYGIVGNKLDVRLFGAGAAGNPETGQGGGGGYMNNGVVTVIPGETIMITIGKGGEGSGGTTSFGKYLSANGGHGANGGSGGGGGGKGISTYTHSMGENEFITSSSTKFQLIKVYSGGDGKQFGGGGCIDLSNPGIFDNNAGIFESMPNFLNDFLSNPPKSGNGGIWGGGACGLYAGDGGIYGGGGSSMLPMFKIDGNYTLLNGKAGNGGTYGGGGCLFITSGGYTNIINDFINNGGKLEPGIGGLYGGNGALISNLKNIPSENGTDISKEETIINNTKLFYKGNGLGGVNGGGGGFGGLGGKNHGGGGGYGSNGGSDVNNSKLGSGGGYGGPGGISWSYYYYNHSQFSTVSSSFYFDMCGGGGGYGANAKGGSRCGGGGGYFAPGGVGNNCVIPGDTPYYYNGTKVNTSSFRYGTYHTNFKLCGGGGGGYGNGASSNAKAGYAGGGCGVPNNTDANNEIIKGGDGICIIQYYIG